ncbi:MAG: DUF924 domain-containing protein [Alphaproteobacteria bacterium]|nr:DUF924 domain-containing protein [Alphaproteobacteria bacterium]
MKAVNPDDVLRFWFEENGRAQWFGKEPAFDDQIRRRFSETVHQARDGKLERWVEAPQTCLALVILIDQFSRNLYRESPLAWSADDHGLAVAKLAVEKGFDRELNSHEKAFLYLPFMHSETLADQERCVALVAPLVDGGDEFNKANYESAIKHRDIIARFGRFPHRNEVLGRESTPEELEFLQQDGSSF